ncbi:MAG: histidine phosphatase family protein, partial [Rhodospirillaceae bacterium]|nr:histidine phosphatase family protein [Rhodospirillaceae bacterium]
LWLTSSLSRARQTAEALRQHIDHIGPPTASPVPVIVETFNEQHFGDWQGLTHDQIAHKRPDEARAFWANAANAHPPGGESFRDVIERVAPTVHQFCQDNPGADIIAVAHAGSIRAALALALDLTPDKALCLDLGHLSLSCIDWIKSEPKEGGVWRVCNINQSAT